MICGNTNFDEMKERININFFIVGAAKSGTTSLYKYLNQHPDIFFPSVKEPHFYSTVKSSIKSLSRKPKPGKEYHDKNINNIDDYLSLYKPSKGQKILADASPSYLWDKEVAQKINKDNPEAKILIILRNPVLRTYSHFLMDLKTGVQQETNIIKAIKDDLTNPEKIWGGAHLYIELSLYFNQIKRYLEVFNKEQVKIVIYEDFFSNIEKGLVEIFDFLEVDNSSIKDIDFTTQHNVYTVPKNNFYRKIIQIKNKIDDKDLIPSKLKELFKKIIFKEKVKPKLTTEEIQFLYNFFKEDILKTEKLLDLDLSNWKF